MKLASVEIRAAVVKFANHIQRVQMICAVLIRITGDERGRRLYPESLRNVQGGPNQRQVEAFSRGFLDPEATRFDPEVDTAAAGIVHRDEETFVDNSNHISTIYKFFTFTRRYKILLNINYFLHIVTVLGGPAKLGSSYFGLDAYIF